MDRAVRWNEGRAANPEAYKGYLGEDKEGYNDYQYVLYWVVAFGFFLATLGMLTTITAYVHMFISKFAACLRRLVLMAHVLCQLPRKYAVVHRHAACTRRMQAS